MHCAIGVHSSYYENKRKVKILVIFLSMYNLINHFECIGVLIPEYAVSFSRVKLYSKGRKYTLFYCQNGIRIWHSLTQSSVMRTNRKQQQRKLFSKVLNIQVLQNNGAFSAHFLTKPLEKARMSLKIWRGGGNKT